MEETHLLITGIGSIDLRVVGVSCDELFLGSRPYLFIGITGLAQLLYSLFKHTPVPITTGTWIFLLNLPLIVLAWKQIGHRFTVFTVIAVVCSSVMIKLLHPAVLTKDPLICAIFGAILNGYGTGYALKSGISTGGLDIISLTVAEVNWEVSRNR